MLSFRILVNSAPPHQNLKFRLSYLDENKHIPSTTLISPMSILRPTGIIFLALK